jgi:heme exporter protein C
MVLSALSNPRPVSFAVDADRLDRIARPLAPWALTVAVLFISAGFAMGLGFGPWDQHQLAMLHIPAVWVALLLLLSAAFWAAVALLTGRGGLHVLVHAIVPTGGMFAFLALWSGSLWIKSLHGAWWLGTAREWAGLALLAVYLAMLCLPMLTGDLRLGDRAVSVLAVLGVASVSLLYFSAEWWNAGEAVRESVAVAVEMVPAMLLVAIGLWAYATATGCLRLRSLLLERRRAPAEMTHWS